MEEAQAAKVVTSGARGGGELPEFLQKPTAGAADVVGELVSAATHAREAEIEPPPTPAVPDDQPTREVLSDLLRSAERTAPEPTE